MGESSDRLDKLDEFLDEILGIVSINELRYNAEEWEEILRVKLYSRAYYLKWMESRGMESTTVELTDSARKRLRES